MTVAALLTVPRNPEDWAVWSLQHWIDHQEINAAIAGASLGSIWTPPLDPVPLGDPEAMANWLENWHEQVHLSMNSATGQYSQDLTSVDFRDQAQTVAWIYLNWQEHQDVHVYLGI